MAVPNVLETTVSNYTPTSDREILHKRDRYERALYREINKVNGAHAQTYGMRFPVGVVFSDLKSLLPQDYFTPQPEPTDPKETAYDGSYSTLCIDRFIIRGVSKGKSRYGAVGLDRVELEALVAKLVDRAHPLPEASQVQLLS